MTTSPILRAASTRRAVYLVRKESPMMKPGPLHVVACPSCKALAWYAMAFSGNTFGARRWTDGKMIAPMCPQPPSFVRCGSCGSLYWLDEAEQKGTFDPLSSIGDNPRLRSAPGVEEPSEAEYYEALEIPPKDPYRELELRTLAWWKSNDPHRGPKGGQVVRFGDDAPPPTEDEAEPAPPHEGRVPNMEALAAILDESNDGALLMKAELLRELGCFPEALALLDRIQDEQLRKLAELFRGYCNAGDSALHVLL